MAFDSLREFLRRLESAGELKRITEPVATELEITEMADWEMKQPEGGKALLFERRPLTAGRRPSRWPSTRWVPGGVWQ